tara:strand:- start:10336 stop:11037 length:702 start_codon:yes stop_codon:yes gene_type:complete
MAYLKRTKKELSFKGQYFSYVPNFEYVNRLKEDKYINAYSEVKNLFKRAKISDDIFQDIVFFERFAVSDGQRPDIIAHEYYNDVNLDWLVLLANNVINPISEWPLDQQAFDDYLSRKYGVENIYNVHHYETTEVYTSNNDKLLDAGLEVDEDFQFSFYDVSEFLQRTVNPVRIVSNFEYETRIQNEKRNIFVLRKEYINIVISDLQRIMPYKEGSIQYVDRSHVKGEDIRIFS